MLGHLYTRSMNPNPAEANLQSAPDEDLMRLVARGFIEKPATELFRRHNRALYNFLAWQCQGNLSEAEDLTQRTWERILTRCADYEPRSAFRTFLFQIGRNLWLDVKRSAGETLREELDDSHHEVPEDDLGPEAAVTLRQDIDRVRTALFALSVGQREVVVLRFFSDMSVEDIAQLIGVGYETVKSRLRYAFSRLRRELEVQP